MNKKQKLNLIKIILCFILLLLNVVLFEVCEIKIVGFGVNLTPIISFIYCLLIYAIIGYEIVFKAIKNIFSGQIFDENFLMTLATIGAFIIGEKVEAVAVMLFYQLGEFFQSLAVSKSRKSIKALLSIRPDYANLLINERIERVLPEKVNVNDEIVVYPGERIPLDGVIVKGQTELDEKSLTGEPFPKFKREGEVVLSGSICLDSEITVRVEKNFSSSTVSKILQMVENASSQKSKAENFITKFAKFYTPIVVFCAIILAIIPSLITKQWSTWVYRALNFLVVSCPCAIVVSVPLAFFACIGKVSRMGVLIKGSQYIERFAKVNHFVFDKTGTLTKGEFFIEKIEPQNKADEILLNAVICEKNSSHPIAKSICSHFGGEIKQNFELTNYPGLGVMAKGEWEILCGNALLMEKFGVLVPKVNENKTMVYVAKNGTFLGYIILADKVKENAFEVIQALKRQKNKTTLLSGDSSYTCQEVKNFLGIDSYYSQLLPWQKAEKISQIVENKGKGEVVCFVGDGLNDAPVLSLSDVGVSMGKIGSDLTVEASDVVIMNDDLSGILSAQKVCKKTIKVAYQNIVFAILIKVVIMVLSSFGLTNLWVSVFGDVGVALLAILNSLRLLK